MKILKMPIEKIVNCECGSVYEISYDDVKIFKKFNLGDVQRNIDGTADGIMQVTVCPFCARFNDIVKSEKETVNYSSEHSLLKNAEFMIMKIDMLINILSANINIFGNKRSANNIDEWIKSTNEYIIKYCNNLSENIKQRNCEEVSNEN